RTRAPGVELKLLLLRRAAVAHRQVPMPWMRLRSDADTEVEPVPPTSPMRAVTTTELHVAGRQTG
ncbi:hypothetical protein E2562_020628, partial [Oryza meyeriana var. granulata]